MDNRIASVIASKKRRKKRKPRPDSLPKLPEVPPGVSTSTPANDQTDDKPNSSTLAIPELTVTPPDDDANHVLEVYPLPEVNILSQSASKRKKKKKKQPVVPVLKDEVRPSGVYTPRSLCKSVNVQPTVSELEEVGEESEQIEGSFDDINVPESSSCTDITRIVPEVLEETSEDVSLNFSESAYGSVESVRSSCISDLSQSLTSLSSKETPIQESQSCPESTDSISLNSPQELTCSFQEPTKPENPCFAFGYKLTDAGCVNGVSAVTKELRIDLKSEEETNENCQVFQSQSINSTQCTFVESNQHQATFTEITEQQPVSIVNHVNNHCDSDNERGSPVHIVENATSTSAAETMPESKSGKVQKADAQVKADKKSELETQQKSKVSAQNIPGTVTAGGKPTEEQKTKAQSKAERKAAFEAAKGSQLAAQKAQGAQKSKSDLKAERRALQEAQRAAKDPTKPAPDPAVQKKPSPVEDEVKSPQKKASPPKDETKAVPSAVITIADPPFKKQAGKVSQEKEPVPEKMRLFSHLPQFQWDSDITANLGLSGKTIHPAIIRAGLRMAQGIITGSDARCVATLAAFREVIQDYTTPPQKELSRDLDAKVKVYTAFLKKCRPLSVSMTNAIKQLKWYISQISATASDEEAKNELCKNINEFIREQVILSKIAIADFASEKIHNNNIILIYGCSPLVKDVLCKAKEKKKNFKVIVVDARPGLDGREMVRYLVGKKIECSYVLINAVSYVMKEVDLVLLDCHSLQANGYVMSRVGSSQIALVAQASNVPVLVCCETYKFCDKVNTDAFVDNELGDPEELISSLPASKSQLQNWRDMQCLNLVNITYDITPADLVTAVVTELCTLPCTSVPVVLRVKHRDTQK